MSDIAPNPDAPTPASAADAAPDTAAGPAPVAPASADPRPREHSAPRGERRPGGGRGRQGRGDGGSGRGQPRAPRQGGATTRTPAPQHPVLKQLAELAPALFGGEAVPLKRGIFQDILAAHPDAFEKDALKTALGLYTRSTRYLVAMASGQPRHDLNGQAVEAVAPEHRHHALLESFRRRHARTGEDVRQALYARMVQAAEESGLLPADYAALVRSKDEAANEILDAAMEELGTRVAREQALLRAFDASGQTVNAFADAYGLHPIEAAATLARAKARLAAPASEAVAEAAVNTSPSCADGN